MEVKVDQWDWSDDQEHFAKIGKGKKVYTKIQSKNINNGSRCGVIFNIE